MLKIESGNMGWARECFSCVWESFKERVMELRKYLAAKQGKALPSSAEHNSHLETMNAESDTLLMHVESSASVDVTYTSLGFKLQK